MVFPIFSISYNSLSGVPVDESCKSLDFKNFGEFAFIFDFKGFQCLEIDLPGPGELINR